MLSPRTLDLVPAVRRSFPWLVAFRWVSNAGIRFAYTFLPAIARGTGLSVEGLARLLALRDLTGLAAPAAGRLSDRIGTPKVMLWAGLVALGGLAASVVGTAGLILGFFAFGIGKIGFDTGLNAWVGHEVPYETRGRAMGVVELAWALAALLLLPVLGVLIDLFGWQAAPLFLVGIGLPVLGRISRLAETSREDDTGAPARPTLDRATVAMYIAFSLLVLASQFLIVGHGLWLEDAYTFNPTRIGVAAVGLGLVELVATTGSISRTDRYGKRPSILGGALLFGLATVCLTITDTPPLPIGLGLLVVAFLGFEFAFVSSLPLIAELDPDARATAIGIALGASTVVRSAGSVVGSWLYVHHGFSSLMATSTLCTVLTVAVTIALVREP